MKSGIRHRLLAVFGALGVAAVANPAPAAADSAYGCGWPRVCFYQTDYEWYMNTPNAAYKDVTSYYQNLSSAARGADHVWNTRNDDRAWLRYIRHATGETSYLCVDPNRGAYFNDDEFTVTGIMIQWEASCP